MFSSNLSTHAGCWSLKTVFMILIYLPRPINGHNTIMRKGRLAVLFLVSIFPKTLKTHSQVKSLLSEPLYSLHCDYLTYLFLITDTDCSLFLPHHVVTELPTRVVKVHTKWGINRPNFERCFHVERPIFWKYVKNWNIYTNHSPVIWRKVVRGRRVTLPAESTLPSVQYTTKTSCPVWQS